MNSSSKVIIAATMVMVVSLVMVLSLVLILLAELYCSLLFRRRRHNSLTLPTTTTTVVTAATTTTRSLAQAISTNNVPSPSPNINPLTTGVLQTPKTYFQKNLSPGNDSVDRFVYISNPMYSNQVTTPFETPESSPSRLETEDSSSSEEENDVGTPALTPMKSLPENACSVLLKGSLESSPSESNSNDKEGVGSSTSSSASPYTSQSW